MRSTRKDRVAGVRAFWMACVALLVAAMLVVPASGSAGFRVGRNVQVSDEPHFQREVALAVNPADDRNLIAAANDGRITLPSCRNTPDIPELFEGCVWVGVYTSRNAGRTWRSDLIPGYPGGPRGVLSEFNIGYDPVVGFDREGTAYAGGIFANVDRSCGQVICIPNLDTSLAIVRSDDGGRTWRDPVVVDRGQGNSVVNDFPRMAVDAAGESEHGSHGNVYVSWNKFDINGAAMMVATSHDRGISWSSAQVNGPPPSGNTFSVHSDPMVAVGPGGQVFVAWDEEFFDEFGLVTSENFWIAVSEDEGRTFGVPRLVETGILPAPLSPFGFIWPVLAVDSGRGTHAGRVYVTWTDGRSGNGDILVKWSDDLGVTWSPSRRVNDDTGTADQYGQWISVAPDGRVDVAFYDRRDDPENVLTTRYYAGSTDGGLTFKNVRVSDKSWDPTKFPFGLAFDEYDMIASTNRAALLVWTDGRNAGPDGVNDDVYSATVFVTRGNHEED